MNFLLRVEMLCLADRVRLCAVPRRKSDIHGSRKRARRDAAAGEQRGIGRLARELLPALDNLDRALAHLAEAPADGSAPAADAQTVEGLRIVHRELHAALASVFV